MEKQNPLDGYKKLGVLFASVGLESTDLVNIPPLAWYAIIAWIIVQGLRDALAAWKGAK